MAHLKQALFSIFTVTAIVTGFGLTSSQAYAGFQFTPAAKPMVAAPATSALPDNGPLMPMVAPDKVDTDTLNQMPTPPLPAMPADPMASGDVAAPKPVPVIKSTSAYPDAIGFGSDLPLALGLRQIVPPQYAYSFDTGVDQGAKISWNGGKPWDIALNEALKPLGYSATVEDNTVHVSSGAPAPVQHSAAIPAPRAPEAQPMMTARAGDIPHPPLSPANDVPAAAPADSGKAVREVYVRRNGANDVEERAPGKPEDLNAQKSITLTPEKNSEKSFWQRVNPENWGTDSADNTAGTSAPDTPAPPMAAVRAPEPAGPVARMSDNDAKLAADNANNVSNSYVPNGPDAMTDAAPAPSPEAPVMLTRGPGEVSKDVAPVSAPPGSLVEQAAPAAPAGDILNNGAVTKWEAKKGDSLKTVLQQWSGKSNVQLYWVPAQDYKLPESINMTGNYTDAVADLLGTYGDKGSRPVGRLHPNLPNGPSVLIIEPASS